jgi:hypothetical protein
VIDHCATGQNAIFDSLEVLGVPKATHIAAVWRR